MKGGGANERFEFTVISSPEKNGTSAYLFGRRRGQFQRALRVQVFQADGARVVEPGQRPDGVATAPQRGRAHGFRVSAFGVRLRLGPTLRFWTRDRRRQTRVSRTEFRRERKFRRSDNRALAPSVSLSNIVYRSL